MKINKLISGSMGDLYMNEEFINDVLLYSDDHKKYFTDKTISVSKTDAYSFQGNLYGLFIHMGLPQNLHLFTMAYNNMTSPVEYTGKDTIFYTPSQDIYSRLENLY